MDLAWVEVDIQKRANRDVVALRGQAITAKQMAGLLGDWRAGSGPGPIYARLALALRALVLDGRAPAAARLPAERPLALALGVSRTTATAAYQLLREDGFVQSRQGGGSWSALPPGRHRRGAPWGPAIPQDADWLDLALAAPAGGDELMEAVAEATGQFAAHLGGHGYEPRGLAILREAIARRYQARGLPTSADQILVTNGSQQAIELVVRTLVSPLEPVVVECPTYPGALDVLARARARLVTVGMSPRGWDSELVVAALRQTLPRLAYLIPDFHNPTGHLMPGACRAAIAEAAAGSGTYLVVDETFVELALDDVVVPQPFACFGDGGLVISLGSMSKAYWAGLRIGWIRATGSLLTRLQEARGTMDMASPIFEQLVAAWLLDHGSGFRSRRRAALASGRDTLVRELAERLGDWRVGVPAGGLSLWVDLGAPVSSALTQAAEGHRLRLAAGPRFGPSGTLDRYLRLPYALGEEDLVEAVSRLAAARADVEAGWRTGPARVPVA